MSRYGYGGEPGWDHADKYGPGVALGDLDGDGALDIVQVRAERNRPDLRPPVVYTGQGDGRFEIAALPPWSPEDNATSVLLFDFDSDSDLDILVGVDGGNVILYENGGNFDFTNVAQEAGLGDVGQRVYASAAGDVDGDGDLDVYLGQWAASLPNHGPGLAPNVLLLNEGSHFVQGPELPCHGSATLGLAMVDLDGDHDLDIYVANDFFEDCLYENLGDGTFRDVSEAAGIRTDAMHAMGVAIGDLNEDGRLDIFVTDTEEPDTSLGNGVFLQTQTPLQFESAAVKLGLDGLTRIDGSWLVSWGVGLIDFDLDGHVDVHTATHVQRPELFWRGVGAGSFTPANDLAETMPISDSRGSAYGDIDGDGDIDIVIGRRQNGLQVLRNDQSSSSAHLRVRILPTTRAVGATVRARIGDTTQVRVIQAGSSYFSSSPATATFGLCDATMVDELEITFADKTTYRTTDIPAGEIVIE